MALRAFLAGLLLLTALGLGLVGYQATRPAAPPAIAAAPNIPELPAPLSVDILVAARGLPAGTLISDADFVARAVPSASIPHDALMDTPAIRLSLRGALLRRYLEAGSNLVADELLHPRDRGFLAAVLGSGTSAITIGVDAISGDGGLIWPGDRVDVILTQELTERDAPLARRFVGETILNDLRVVAVDQSITQGATTTSDNAAGHLARTVTLEVNAQQAEQMAVAERLGKLNLAVRAMDGRVKLAGRRTVLYSGDVSAALASGGTSGAPRMRVIEGSGDREVTFR